MNISVSAKTLKHLPHYRFYLQQLKKTNREFVSNERLAADLKLSITAVRKDLENLHESLSANEIHSVDTLIKIVESYLGYDQKNAALIVGAGSLGNALLNYRGFQTCGLEILAIFDNNPQVVGQKMGGKEVFRVDRLGELTYRLKANIGIITTPPEPAQRIADVMIENGIKGIWNFSLAIIKVPDNIMLRNTSLYSEYLRLMQTMLNASSDEGLTKNKTEMKIEKLNIRLCLGSSCYSRGNDEILKIIEKYINEKNLNQNVDFRGYLCKGQCSKGPNLSIGDKEFHKVSHSNIHLILKEVFETEAPFGKNLL